MKFMTPKARASRLAKLGASVAVVAATSLGACAPSLSTLPSYEQNHRVVVAETVERMELYVRPQGMNLSARDRAAMQGFVNLYSSEGDGGLYLNVPSNMAGAPGMRQAQAEIQNLMLAAGLNGAPVQSGQYPAAPNAPAPLVLSFRRLATQPIDCLLNQNLSRTYNNQPVYNFGCAQQANFAAMIGDPRQLVDPYLLAAPNAARRTIGFDKYVAGESPASAQPDRQEVSAAEAVGSE